MSVVAALGIVAIATLTGGPQSGTVPNMPYSPYAPPHYTEGPCIAIHYGRPGYPDEISMAQVVTNRQTCPGRHCISGFVPRKDVSGFIAVRYADFWRIANNYRALVVFRLKNGKDSSPIWLQPADYQAPWDVTSSRCRVETSEAMARSMGWSSFQGWGRTTAYVVRWER